jgi:hypothetical protein
MTNSVDQDIRLTAKEALAKLIPRSAYEKYDLPNDQREELVRDALNQLLWQVMHNRPGAAMRHADLVDLRGSTCHAKIARLIPMSVYQDWFMTQHAFDQQELITAAYAELANQVGAAYGQRGALFHKYWKCIRRLTALTAYAKEIGYEFGC